MSKKQQVPNRQYTDEFKVEAMRLAESIGASQAAKTLGIPDSSMWNWLRLQRAGKLKAMRTTRGQTKPGVRDLEVENERLRRELANAKMDFDIVKKAAAFLAKEPR
ncbi:MAG: transposase [Gammaproteobacteria bacterium]|jgi:transposase